MFINCKYNIGIIDADLIGRPKHRFPNLACMKISGYYKSKNYNVKLITDYKDMFCQCIELHKNQEPKFSFIMYDDKSKKNFIKYYKKEDIIFDKIIISKVFTDTLVPLQIENLDICEYGGTGFFYDKAEPLPEYIEHYKPDYNLYDEWVETKIKQGTKQKELKYYTDYSIGFTTRGCFRKCSFCVNKNYNKVEKHSDLNEFLDDSKKYICLLDDNVLGFKHWEDIFDDLIASKKSFQYKQGMDMRIMTNKKAEKLSKCKYMDRFIFSFDDINDTDKIIKNLKIWKKYKSTKRCKFYVLCAYDRENKYDEEFWVNDIICVFKRIIVLMEFGSYPYLMRYEKYKDSPYYGIYVELSAWCNQPNIYQKKSFREFCIMKGENSLSYNRITCFQNKYPEIVSMYFDLKYSDLIKY